MRTEKSGWYSVLCNAFKFYSKRKRVIKTCERAGKRKTFVIFRAVGLDPFHAFTKNNFDHCSVVFCDYDNKYYGVLIDQHLNCLDVKIMLHEQVKDFFKFIIKSGGCVIRGEIAPTKELNRFFSLEPVNCVAITKMLLGVRKMFIWTPYQLYKFLMIKHNFKRFENEQWSQS